MSRISGGISSRIHPLSVSVCEVSKGESPGDKTKEAESSHYEKEGWWALTREIGCCAEAPADENGEYPSNRDEKRGVSW